MTDEQYQRGIEQFAHMVGEGQIDALRERFRQVSPEFERAVMGIVGGEIWTRPNLDLRTRSLVSVAVLAALGRANALELNIRMALNNGATEEELVETFFQVAIYAGFAAAWDGLEKMRRVIDQTADQRQAEEPDERS
ncbi:MAG: 4-carboxymuconolactone decarboxylase [Chloroflexi bacterium]|nr:MAG: 4-carboxymuconolactone decarboxylase [Chloroflexota bacterium]